MDGPGYPKGLLGENTFMEARIMAAADNDIKQRKLTGMGKENQNKGGRK